MRWGLWLWAVPLALFGNFGMQTKAEAQWKYQNLAFDAEDFVLTGRLAKAFDFRSGWGSFLQLEAPYTWLWGNGEEVIGLDEDGIVTDNPNPAFITTQKSSFREAGLGDVQTKAFITTPEIGQFRLGFGSSFTFPTAQAEEIGTGKYSATPTVGIKYDFPFGASLIGITKYQFSFAGESSRPSFRILTMQPIFALSFYEHWVFALESETQFNCKTKKWFVPISVTLGRRVGRFNFNVQYQRGLITDFPVFQDEASLTAAYLF